MSAPLLRRIVVALAGLVALASMLSTSPAATSDDLMYARPGRLVDVGGFRLNLRCFGTGRPTVVFDAGLGDWSPAWSTVQPAIARRTRTCSYDRAGNGFSDAGPMPRTSSRIADELHVLLQRAGERPPYVLVGHSFGSYNVRLYADRYLSDVAGIVLVDGSHEDQNAALHLHGLGEVERGLATCERLATGGFHGTARDRRACIGQYFRGLPEARFSPQLNAVLEAQALTAKQNRATLSEAHNFNTLSADEVRAAKRSYGDIPLLILTANDHGGPDEVKHPAVWRTWEAAWRRLHDSWLPLSTRSREIVADGSGHYIQFDRTSLVIETIDDVLRSVRKNEKAAS